MDTNEDILATDNKNKTMFCICVHKYEDLRSYDEKHCLEITFLKRRVKICALLIRIFYYFTSYGKTENVEIIIIWIKYLK